MFSIAAEVGRCYDKLDFRNGLNLLADMCTHVNKYFTDSEPWVARKSADQTRLNNILCQFFFRFLFFH